MDLVVSLSSRRPEHLLRALHDQGWPMSTRPVAGYVDRKSIDASVDWVEKVVQAHEEGSFRWEPLPGAVSAFALFDRRDGMVKLRLPGRALVAEIVTVLAPSDAELAATESFPEWRRKQPRYSPPSFGGQHYGHGWMCAFKGAGHDRLFSRRWLEHGPWRLIRVPEVDLSVVQFHDLEADPVTALEQAREGHRMLGGSPVTGVFRNPPKPPSILESGLYHADTRTTEFVVFGRDVSPAEMAEAAEWGRRFRSDPRQPVDHVAYVFIDEDEARRHLHALWLRGLQCHAIVRGDKVRLDADYVPPPHEPPEWVRRVEAQTSGPNALAR